jgi:hypothetical protein
MMNLLLLGVDGPTGLAAPERATPCGAWRRRATTSNPEEA